MLKMNIHEARTQFSKLIARVEAGEEVAMARDGAPVARVVAFREAVSKRIPGRDRGLFSTPNDFDAPLPSAVLEDFEA